VSGEVEHGFPLFIEEVVLLKVSVYGYVSNEYGDEQRAKNTLRI
jgi:hypothetical protein